MFKTPNIMLRAPSSTGKARSFPIRVKDKLLQEPCEFERKQYLVALTIHKLNFLPLRRKLIKSNIIDNKYQWKPKNHDIILFIDTFEGDNISNCLWLLYSLEEKAKVENSYLHIILNPGHLVDLKDEWALHHPEYPDAPLLHQSTTALYQGNKEIWNWLKTKNVIEKIGNMTILHDTTLSYVANNPVSLTELNQLINPLSDSRTSFSASAASTCHLPVSYLPFFGTSAILYATHQPPTQPQPKQSVAVWINAAATDEGAHFAQVYFNGNTYRSRIINTAKSASS
ncbi:hypothetical protein [Paraflavitalea pollutisoli]|uniref:hypothetical protein n=1 Tax=Paraflavitalea pollutisoli TaxID=3034143 RepID=UPI0023EB4C76|nr:hypothetical protein [Paraflavitalea sp. H1-2-19X]